MNVRSKGDRIFETVSHIILVILCICAVVPFICLSLVLLRMKRWRSRMVISSSRKIQSGRVQIYFERMAAIGNAYIVTIFVTVVGTGISIIITSMFAFGLTIRDVPGVKVVFFLTLFTMLFNGGIVSTYYIYSNLIHIKNTIWALIIPGLLMSAFNVILVKNYITSNIPKELIEAAEIDGAGLFRIYITVIMPLSTPILATVGLMSAVSYWNDWNNGLYYITDNKLYSIQQLLNQMNNSVQYLLNNASKMTQVDMVGLPSVTIRMAIAVVAIFPILCAYPFFQKYFAKGIVVGAVKG